MNIIQSKDNDDYSSIINQRHFDRINSLIENLQLKQSDINQINPSNEEFFNKNSLKYHQLVTNTILKI